MSQKSKKGMTRRNLIKGALGATALGGLAWARPNDLGAQDHNAYFQSISRSLQSNNVATPSMVVDKTVMANNIQTLVRHMKGRFDYRIVAKSLPSIEMLKWTMAQAGTNKLMVFHQPFLSTLAKDIPNADVLMGKPMPVAAARIFYQGLVSTQTTFDAPTQLQWLLDSQTRLQQYAVLAADLKQTLNINIELDVGLHRGGVTNEREFITMLETIEQHPYLRFSGLMGYEPHIGKVPGDPITHRDQAMDTYRDYVALAEKQLGRSVQDLTLNAAGSPTYQYYNEGKASSWPMNELSAGSCLVKPSDFDLPTLADHKAAAFIASPVLKVLDETQIPGVSGLGKIMAMWNQNWQKTFFAYGGFWKANPVSPKGLTLNPVYGRSSNQEMYNGSASVQLKQDDFIFLRPTQSEAVFLQFGDILVIEKGVLAERWPILQG